MLDFLLTFVPLENKELSTSDVVSILVCCLNVVLRRDMSLNRRLYQWILSTANENLTEDSSRKSSVASSGTAIEENAVSPCFENVTKKYVVAAVVTLFRSISGGEVPLSHIRIGEKIGDKLKPFRVLVSLLDKPEIGSAILEDVLTEVFRALYHECSAAVQGKDRVNQHRHVKDELIKTANILFNAFESYFIWEYLERALRRSFQRDQESSWQTNGQNDGIFEELEMEIHHPDCSELFTLTDFLLDVVSVVSIFGFQPCPLINLYLILIVIFSFYTLNNVHQNSLGNLDHCSFDELFHLQQILSHSEVEKCPHVGR